MSKLNCWEVMKCGREAGGNKVETLGICSAFIDTSFDGLNDGKNGGRICWASSGTLCETEPNCTKRAYSCMSCEFFKSVRKEKGDSFVLLKDGQSYKPVKNIKL